MPKDADHLKVKLELFCCLNSPDLQFVANAFPLYMLILKGVDDAN